MKYLWVRCVREHQWSKQLLVESQGTWLQENTYGLCIEGSAERNQATSKERKSVMFFFLYYIFCLFVGWIHVCYRALQPEGETQELTLRPSQHSRSLFQRMRSGLGP